MKSIIDFVHAALPWIAMGLLLAVFFANQAKHKGNEDNTEDGKRNNENYGLLGMLIGMSLGCALSLITRGSVGIDMCTGMLFGLAVGMSISKRENGEEQ